MEVFIKILVAFLITIVLCSVWFLLSNSIPIFVEAKESEKKSNITLIVFNHETKETISIKCKTMLKALTLKREFEEESFNVLITIKSKKIIELEDEGVNLCEK